MRWRISENWAQRHSSNRCTGSRGDFAQAVHGEAALVRYLDEVSRYYDSILIQPIVAGIEYRIFLLDDEVVYAARKYPPFVLGDGARTIRDLLAAHNDGSCERAAFRRLRWRITMPRSTPCRPRASAGKFPGG